MLWNFRKTQQFFMIVKVNWVIGLHIYHKHSKHEINNPFNSGWEVWNTITLRQFFWNRVFHCFTIMDKTVDLCTVIPPSLPPDRILCLRLVESYSPCTFSPTAIHCSTPLQRELHLLFFWQEYYVTTHLKAGPLTHAITPLSRREIGSSTLTSHNKILCLSEDLFHLPCWGFELLFWVLFLYYVPQHSLHCRRVETVFHYPFSHSTAYITPEK